MIFYGLGILLAMLTLRLIFHSFRFVVKMAVNIFLGGIILMMINALCNGLGISGIDLNPLSAFIAGFFGLPGVIFLAIFKIFL